MSNIGSYENIHFGERCFVIGCGPSLGITPLHLLEDEISFGLNNISKVYSKTTWRPTYYFNIGSGPDQWRDAYMRAMESIDLGIPSFIRSASPLPDRPNVIRFERESKIYPDFSKWSLDCSKIIYHWRTSIYGLMQLVIYMGFKKVYLLGCDLGYSPNKPTHCYDEINVDWTEDQCAYENHYQIEAHRKIRFACNTQGVEVYNATIGGELEVYERVKLDDLLC